MSTDLDALIARLQSEVDEAALAPQIITRPMMLEGIAQIGRVCADAAAALTDLRRQVAEKDAEIARAESLWRAEDRRANENEYRADDAEAKLAAAEQRLRHVQAETWEQAAEILHPTAESGDCGRMLDGVMQEFLARAQAAREGT